MTSGGRALNQGWSLSGGRDRRAAGGEAIMKRELPASLSEDDVNSTHLDRDYAATDSFNGVIAHSL